MCEVTRLALRVISDPWLERSLLEAQRTLVGTGSVAIDPQRTNAAAMQQFFGTSAALSGSVLCAGVSVARAT